MRTSMLFSFLLVVLLHSGVVAQAQNRQPVQYAPSPAAKVTLKHFIQQSDRNWVVRWSRGGTRVTSLIGHKMQPLAQKGQVSKIQGDERARAFLNSNAALFGLKTDLADLKLLRKHTSFAGQHVELQQTYQGLPVENGRVKVNLDRDGRILQVVNSYLPNIDIPTKPTLSEDEAKEKAIARFLQELAKRPVAKNEQQPPPLTRKELKLKEPAKVERIVFLVDEGQRATVAFKVLIKAEPDGIMEFVVDGQTGEILRVRDFEVYSVDGIGNIFNPNPVQVLNDITLVDNGDAAAAIPAGAYENNAPLRDLDDPVGGVHRISGPFVISEDIHAPGTATITEAGTTFNYDRSQDGFEEVMIYHYIDRSQRYIQTLGFIDANNRQIRVDAHGRTDDNASYRFVPIGAGYLRMGDGGADAAEDADVILHEYGHSIQDNQNPGAYLGGGHAGSIGEGFSDYWALSNHLDASIAQGWDPACYAEWDWLNHWMNTAGATCARNADNAKVYPTDYIGAIHTDGELWSGALWDILTDMGKTTADRLALQSHYNMPSNPSFAEGADAVMTADLQIFYGSHLEALCQIFINRGFYAAADCPEIPSGTGGQDTLVVLARFNEDALPDTPISAADVTNTINNLNNYLTAVSYGQAPLTHITTGWHELPGTRGNYYDGTSANVLIDLVEDAIDVVAIDRPDIIFSNFDRLLIITNDDGSVGETRGQNDWATTGPWPYDVPTAFGNKLLSVSVHTFQHQEAQFTHALGHHFGMEDLYAHEGAIFPRPYADGWGNMADDGAGNFTNVHFMGWNKLKPEWLDDADVRFIPRPNVSFPPQSFPLSRQSVDGAQRELIQVGTTAEVTDRLNERVSFYIEARAQAADAYDANVPSDGVLVYYVNEDISQGFGPLRIVDATPGDNNLTNAALQIGDPPLTDIDDSGLNVEVLTPTGTEDYQVRISYTPPATDVDAWIHVHDQNWRSMDIWVDSPVNGLDGVGNTREPADRGDTPKPGQTNRIYARVYNHGPGIAHNVHVDLWVSDPYQGIDGGGVDPDTGGNVTFNKHFSKVIETLPVTDDGVTVWVEWIPEPVPPGQSGPHACVKVKIADVLNDINDYNQVTQENIREYDTTSDSPYDPVVQPIQVANPYDRPILVYLRADKVPVGWTANVIPEKTYLNVGGSVLAQVEIQAPEDYPVCSTEYITVSAWYPSGDTLLQLGGSTAQVNLKQSVVIDLETELGPCDRQQPLTHAIDSPSLLDIDDSQSCKIMHSKGCTNPPRPYEHITLEYTAPDGETIYHDIVTDENGCFEDFLVNPSGGVWQTEATYPGNECHAADTTGGQSVVVPPGPLSEQCIPCRWLWVILILFAFLLLWLYRLWYQCCYKQDSPTHG